MVSTIEQLRQVINYKFRRIYAPIGVLTDYVKQSHSSVDELSFNGKSDIITITLPAIIKSHEANDIERKLDALRGITNVCINNISGLIYADKYKLYGGMRLNITNSESVRFYAERGLRSILLSPELSLPQIRDIKKVIPCEIVAYGYLPIMLTENNIKSSNLDYIEDRMGVRFPVINEDGTHRCTLLNSRPVVMYDKLRDIKKIKTGCNLFFSIENANETNKVCSLYFDGGDILPKDNFTRGCYYR